MCQILYEVNIKTFCFVVIGNIPHSTIMNHSFVLSSSLQVLFYLLQAAAYSEVNYCVCPEIGLGFIIAHMDVSHPQQVQETFSSC